MCGSDLHQLRRPKGVAQATGLPMPDRPVIAGHEPCGVVAAIGTAVSPAQAKIGQRVMVHHYQGCTVCEHCRSGWQQLCQNVPVKVYGNNSDGGHAPYMKVPANTLVTLPDELSFEAGAAIACGTGTAYGALRRINLSGNDTIAIFAAVRSAKVWGTCCFVGEGGDVTINVSPDMLRRQLTIIASWTFSSVGQEECARFCVDRKVAVDDLFTHRWKLDQAEEAYRIFDRQTEGKGVFLM